MKEVSVHTRAVSNLATLLLGMFRSYVSSKKVRVEEERCLDILRTYKALVPRIGDVSDHIMALSRLFGPPPTPSSVLNMTSVRSMLLEVKHIIYHRVPWSHKI